jgi:predicted secreted protein
MAKINASNVKILVGNVQISNLTNCNFEVNVDMIDVTTKDSAGWKEILSGLKDWKMGGDITVDFALATNAADDIFTTLVAGGDVSVKFNIPGSGNALYTGVGKYSQQSFEAGTEDKLTSKFSIMGNGQIVQTLNP